MAAMNLSRFGAAALLALAMVHLSAGFVAPSNRIPLQQHARQQVRHEYNSQGTRYARRQKALMLKVWLDTFLCVDPEQMDFPVPGVYLMVSCKKVFRMSKNALHGLGASHDRGTGPNALVLRLRCLLCV